MRGLDVGHPAEEVEGLVEGHVGDRLFDLLYVAFREGVEHGASELVGASEAAGQEAFDRLEGDAVLES